MPEKGSPIFISDRFSRLSRVFFPDNGWFEFQPFQRRKKNKVVYFSFFSDNDMKRK